jgi:hypothetical protein
MYRVLVFAGAFVVAGVAKPGEGLRSPLRLKVYQGTAFPSGKDGGFSAFGFPIPFVAAFSVVPLVPLAL